MEAAPKLFGTRQGDGEAEAQGEGFKLTALQLGLLGDRNRMGEEAGILLTKNRQLEVKPHGLPLHPVVLWLEQEGQKNEVGQPSAIMVTLRRAIATW